MREILVGVVTGRGGDAETQRRIVHGERDSCKTWSKRPLSMWFGPPLFKDCGLKWRAAEIPDRSSAHGRRRRGCAAMLRGIAVRAPSIADGVRRGLHGRLPESRILAIWALTVRNAGAASTPG